MTDPDAGGGMRKSPDGRWFPVDAGGSATPPNSTPGGPDGTAGRLAPPGGSGRGTGSGAVSGPGLGAIPGLGRRRPVNDGPRPNRRRTIGIVAAVVVVVLFVAVPLLSRDHQAGALHVGSGDAVVNWTSSPPTDGRPATASFSGTVDGLTLTGTATSPGAGSTGTTPPGTGSVTEAFPAATWTGTLGSAPFSVAVAAGTGDTATVQGTWGGQRVALTVAAPAPQDQAEGFVVHGTVGPTTVTGSITHPVQSGDFGRATATFDVSS